MEIRLYGHCGAIKTDVEAMEGKWWAIPITFTIVFDPLAKVTIERVEGV